jgi:hypothetical protein
MKSPALTAPNLFHIRLVSFITFTVRRYATARASANNASNGPAAAVRPKTSSMLSTRSLPDLYFNRNRKIVSECAGKA